MSIPSGNRNLPSSRDKSVNALQPVDAARIEQCLNESDDFAFEMEVLYAIRQANLNKIHPEAEHGGTYRDPVTGLPRQFDIRVKVARTDLGHQAKYFIRLAIECKRLTDQAPLVIARSTRAQKETGNLLIRSCYLDSNVTRAEVKRTLQSMYRSGTPVGRSAVQIRSDKNRPDGDGEIYGKWAQALASVSDLIWEGGRDACGPAIRVSYSMPMACLVVPNGTLWAVDYDSEGTRSAPPIQVDEVEFYVARRYEEDGMDFSLSHLHILTTRGLVSLLENRLSETEFWVDHFPQE
ncbi:hypothetical protein [Luteolibacter soli]|uniref:Restriction endonuclease n=1 Tax=Luteolibacter soli TaxID=3135280 RepID=A0ABU9ARU5_9BACT